MNQVIQMRGAKLPLAKELNRAVDFSDTPVNLPLEVPRVWTADNRPRYNQRQTAVLIGERPAPMRNGRISSRLPSRRASIRDGGKRRRSLHRRRGDQPASMYDSEHRLPVARARPSGFARRRPRHPSTSSITSACGPNWDGQLLDRISSCRLYLKCTSRKPRAKPAPRPASSTVRV